MKKIADVVPHSFHFEGAAAQDVAAFLGIARGGTLPLELGDYLKTQGERNQISWDPTQQRLTFEGHWYDWASSEPRRKGPRFSFDAPADLDQKSLSLFKAWAVIHQRVQAHGKSIGRRAAEIRRGIVFPMESDAQRKGFSLKRAARRLLKKTPVVAFESLVERTGKGLWLEVRVGDWVR